MSGTAEAARPVSDVEHTAWVGLGSNLRAPREQVLRAVEALGTLRHTRLAQCSPLYLSRPHGPWEQPPFVNAVAEIRTRLEPHALLASLQELERAQGRIRGVRWGPRPLDLDILLYGDREIRDDVLVIPHPRIGEREFVLYPLRDLAPAMVIPGLGRVSELAAALPPRGMERLDGT